MERLSSRSISKLHLGSGKDVREFREDMHRTFGLATSDASVALACIVESMYPFSDKAQCQTRATFREHNYPAASERGGGASFPAQRQTS